MKTITFRSCMCHLPSKRFYMSHHINATVLLQKYLHFKIPFISDFGILFYTVTLRTLCVWVEKWEYLHSMTIKTNFVADAVDDRIPICFFSSFFFVTIEIRCVYVYFTRNFNPYIHILHHWRYLLLLLKRYNI